MRENSNNSQTRNFEGKLNFLGQPHKKQSNKKSKLFFSLTFTLFGFHYGVNCIRLL